jgi:hemolysin III
MSDHSHSHGDKHDPKFSAPLFMVTVAVSLAVLCGAMAWLTPTVWQAQLQASGLALFAVFLVVHAAAGIGEFFFHRYVLHAPLVPFLSHFYKQHTLHHALTRVGFQKSRKGDGEVPYLVENHYPIVEEKQFEASYFPWYSLIGFSAFASIFLIPAQILLPSAPVMLGGFLAVTWSMCLYELIHAVEHWPQATWDRLIEHPRLGSFWRKAYAFHLRHHADIRCNEAISGVFGLPVVDWVLGTYVDPETLYRDGQTTKPEEFVSPRPRFGIIRWLDQRADHAVKHRRQQRSRV